MKSLCEEYILARTVEEALQILTEAQGEARLVSGGSDLLLDLQQGAHPPTRILVDVTEVGEMCALEIRDGCLYIGASVTLAQLEKSSLVNQHAQALSEAVSMMGNPQVCNVATIGGNVAHALPAADGTIALLALGAQAEVASAVARRRMELQGLFKGPGLSTLDPDGDVLVGFYLPLHQTGQASAFSRRTNPQGIPLAILNIAIWLLRDGERIGNIRIAAGPAGRIPLRMQATEKVISGQILTERVRKHALEELLREAQFRTSPHRASKEYRQQLAGILLQETLDKAWQRC